MRFFHAKLTAKDVEQLDGYDGEETLAAYMGYSDPIPERVARVTEHEYMILWGT